MGTPQAADRQDMPRSTPGDGGLEPPLEEVVEYAVTGARGIKHVRIGVIYDRDPHSAARRLARQNEAILDLLRWARDHPEEFEAAQVRSESQPAFIMTTLPVTCKNGHERTVKHAFNLAKGKSVSVKNESVGPCPECDEDICIADGTYSEHEGGIRFKPSSARSRKARPD
jgi:hypothetical protein